MFDVAVIGGGSTGTSIAYHLARRGYRTALVERRGIGAGMTALSTGVVRSFYSVPEVARMAAYSHSYFLRFAEEHGVDVFTRCGLIVVGRGPDADAIRANVEMLRGMGIGVRLLAPDEARALVPGLEVGEGEAAALEEGAGYADTTATARAFHESFLAHGGTHIADEAVALRRGEGGVEAALCRRGEVKARTYVVATNVWANRLLSQIGAELPIRVVREDIMVVDRGAWLVGTHPVVADLANNFYMRPEGDARSLVGSLDPGPRHVEDPDAFNPTASHWLESAPAYAEAIARRIPPLTHAGAAGGWSGLYDVTPDWQPIVDWVDANVLACVGLSGHGFKLAPALGLLAAELVEGGPRTFGNPFALDRLRRGAHRASRYSAKVVG